MRSTDSVRGKGSGYPTVHERPAIVRSFDRLEKLWARYPQHHEMTTFSTMEALAAEHESWQADFEEVRGEYMENQYDRFLVQLSWSDLPYRYAAKEKIQAAGPLPANPYVEAFMEQFAGLDTDHKACFLFPESFLSQFFVIMEICRNAESVRPVRNLFPDEEKPHYLAVFDKRQMDDVLLMFHLLYTNGSSLGGPDPAAFSLSAGSDREVSGKPAMAPQSGEDSPCAQKHQPHAGMRVFLFGAGVFPEPDGDHHAPVSLVVHGSGSLRGEGWVQDELAASEDGDPDEADGGRGDPAEVEA